MARRYWGFVMDSDKVSVPHIVSQVQGERFHIAQEVREAGSKLSEGHGPGAAEEFVRGLLPWAQASALGLVERLPQQNRRYAAAPRGSRKSNHPAAGLAEAA